MTSRLVRPLALVATAAIGISLVPFGVANAADPESISFGTDAAAVDFVAGPFTVSGPTGAGCLPGGADPSCDYLPISLGNSGLLTIETANSDETRAAAEDHDITLKDSNGNAVAFSAKTGSEEVLSVSLAPGHYMLESQAFLVLPESSLLGTASFVPADHTDPGGEGDVLACLEAVPEFVTPSVPGLAGETIDLTVGVYLDGVSEAAALDLFQLTKQSYEPLGIDLTATVIGAIDLVDRGSLGEDDRDTASAEDAIGAAKLATGSSRTTVDADVVYVLTDKDIFVGSPGSDDQDVDDADRNYAVVGLADCIGGVRFDGNSYAVSEVDPGLEEFQFLDVPVSFYYQATSDTIAHEIGHLMGAHHHYANCGEGLTTENGLDGETIEASPCSLMTNFVDFTSTNFSMLSSAVVRGHAEGRAASR